MKRKPHYRWVYSHSAWFLVRDARPWLWPMWLFPEGV